jgi:hypothetical protein
MKLANLYRHYSHCHPDDIKELKEQAALYEGLIQSFAPKQMVQLIHNLHTSGKVTYNKHNPYVLDVTFTSPVPVEHITSVFERTKVGGWFLATAAILTHGALPKTIKAEQDLIETISQLPRGVKIQLVFEAKYGYDVTQEIVDTCKYLYHATPAAKVTKILQLGLSPKTLSKLANHPERIYLASDIQQVELVLIPHFKKLTKEDKDWKILQIGCNAFKQLGVRLFNDPAFPGGVYTLSNISPIFITLVK